MKTKWYKKYRIIKGFPRDPCTYSVQIKYIFFPFWLWCWPWEWFWTLEEAEDYAKNHNNNVVKYL